MTTTSYGLWLRRLVALAALCASGCVDALVGEAETCSVKGKAYAEGEDFQDGCMSCTCQADGKVECKPTACADGGDDAGGWDDDADWEQDAGASGPWTDNPQGMSEGCTYGSKRYAVGEKFPLSDGCGWCACAGPQKPTCTIEPKCRDAEVPGCVYGDKSIPVGISFFTGDACNSCLCADDGELQCTMRACDDNDAGTDGGQPDADDPNVPIPGTCDFFGKTLKIGEGFMHPDGCNKCWCAMDGKVQCSAESCMTPSRCYLGGDSFALGHSLVCPDGCNTCTCTQSGFAGTKIACPALPPITACPNDLSISAFPAQLVYIEKDALAVADSRCVNGQTNDFQLCYDGFHDPGMAPETHLYVFAGTTTRACNAQRTERVFSLAPLREALLPQYPNGGKLLLHGNNRALVYYWP